MENGANGDDETEIRPDGGFFAMVEWVVDVLPIAMAATISCAPTIGFLRALEMLTGDAIPTTWAFDLIAVYAAYSLFSLIFLSMLENNSIIGIYSAQVWKSVATQASSWFKFWSLTTPLFGALAAIVLGCLELREMPFNGTLIGLTILTMSLLTCVLAIYFRLLGRLAFVLTSQPSTRRKHSAKTDREERENLEISTTGV